MNSPLNLPLYVAVLYCALSITTIFAAYIVGLRTKQADAYWEGYTDGYTKGWDDRGSGGGGWEPIPDYPPSDLRVSDSKDNSWSVP